VSENVKVLCPKCQSKYELNRGLVGQKIRCPNPACREVFEVREAAGDKPKTTKSPTTKGDRRAPTFESETENIRGGKASESASPKEADWSQLPPPPVRKTEKADVPVATETEVANDRATAAEVLAWMNMTPAEEQPAGEPVAEAAVDELPATEDDYQHTYDFAPPPRRGRWITWGILFLVIVVAGGVMFNLYYNSIAVKKKEAEMVGLAEKDMADNRFGAAKSKYEDLVRNFSKSESVPRYQFLAQFCDAREKARNSDPAQKRFLAFEEYLNRTKENDKYKEWLRERQAEVWQTGVAILDDQIKQVKKEADAKNYEGAKALLDAKFENGKDVIAQMQKLVEDNAPRNQVPPVPEHITTDIRDAREGIDREQRLTTFVKHVEGALKTPNLSKVTIIEKEAEAEGYRRNPQVVNLIDEAKTKLRALIVWKPDPQAASQPLKSELQSLVITATAGTPPKAEGPERVVFAVARGVLFALVEGTGKVLWTTRVGIDTTALPLRVQAGNTELAIVPTPDGRGLIAYETLTGKTRWFATLPATCRGKPIRGGNRVFVPLNDEQGTVVALEIYNGQRVGSIPLGQKLASGGVYQDATKLLYIPAESQNVFVLNTDVQSDAAGNDPPAVALVDILPTGHGGGALRGELVVIGGEDVGGTRSPSYLILGQNYGLEQMQIRTFRLALGSKPPMTELKNAKNADQNELAVIDGWSWFAPLCDNEGGAIVTDTGTLALFGFGQPGGQDAPVYLKKIQKAQAGSGHIAGRGQVVHATANEYWYIANGEMKLLRCGLDRKVLDKYAEGWKQGVPLGTPLHAAQVSGDRELLIVVTQTSTPPACLATAVEAKTGAIRWQRSLGLTPQGDPVVIGGKVLQIDQSGGVYLIDPAQNELKPQAGQEWYQGGQVLLPPRTDVSGETVLLPTADGKSAYAIVPTDGGTRLRVWQIVPGQAVKELPAVALGAAMAGSPVLAGNALLVARVNGSLFRQVLGNDKGENGPDWGPKASADSRVYILPLEGNDLLVTDGGKGITKFSWPAGGTFQFKGHVDVPGRIVGPLLLVPADKAPQVVAVDATGQLSLLNSGDLGIAISWQRLGSEITGGPYLIGGKGQPVRILVVTDRVKLYCLDPANPAPAWNYRTKFDGIAGRPIVSGTNLLVADLAGRYDSIDLQTGSPTGQSYPATGVLPAAPAGAPVDFSEGRLFAPLSDGTILLLPQAK
jgi:outer membrane protein assembly factor BamB